MKLQFLRLLKPCWLAAAALLTVASLDAKPNVLFIAVDDLRPELGCYGNPVLTPNIDQIASKGLVLDRAYCQQAVCSPTRSSLLTGTRPDTTKVWDLNTHFRKALPDVVTLPQLFKNNGYVTQGMGKIYHHGFDDAPSWSIPTAFPTAKHGAERAPADPDTPLNAKTRRGPPFGSPDIPDNAMHDGALADMAVSALGKLHQQGQPFFLAVGFIKPHLPFIAPKKYWDLYDPATIALAPNPFRPKGAPPYAVNGVGEVGSYGGVPAGPHLPDDYARKLKHGYYAAVSYMDAQVGRVLAELDRLKLRDNTIIVLWGDHGWKLGEHDAWAKHSNVENDTRVPLIISAPGMPAAGQHSSALVEFVDVFPTLAELADLPLPSYLEGRSFKPLLADPKQPWKAAAFSQYPRKVGKQNLMGYSMRTDRYRLTRWVVKGDLAEVKAVELYDHQKDPQENTNIADDPANQELVKQLTQQWLAGWQAAQAKPAPSKPAQASLDFWKMEYTQPVPLPPTQANVPYGSHPKQVLDFWKADSKEPTPLVFFIHGGAWKSNDKDRVSGLRSYLAAGISVVSINYRFVQEAEAAGIKPPVLWPLQDAARALQFVRSKATEWNFDKTRIGASGGSAGACSSLWLAFHNEMADPNSADPISRESTRLACAGVVGAQTTLDPQQMKDWTPNSVYGGHAFGFNGDKAKKIAPFQQFLASREKILPWIKEYSPYELVTADDPPVYLFYSDTPALGKTRKDPTHTANFGVKLQEKMQQVGVECQLMYPGVTTLKQPDPVAFLIDRLKSK